MILQFVSSRAFTSAIISASVQEVSFLFIDDVRFAARTRLCCSTVRSFRAASFSATFQYLLLASFKVIKSSSSPNHIFFVFVFSFVISWWFFYDLNAINISLYIENVKCCTINDAIRTCCLY